MNCRSVQNNLSAYLDRELSGEEMMEIRAHLANCSVCQQEARDIRALKALLGSMSTPDPNPEFERLLTASVLKHRPAAPKVWRVSAMMFAVVAAVSMAFTLSLVSNSDRVDKSQTLERDREISAAVRRDQVYTSSVDPYGAGAVALPVIDDR